MRRSWRHARFPFFPAVRSTALFVDGQRSWPTCRSRSPALLPDQELLPSASTCSSPVSHPEKSSQRGARPKLLDLATRSKQVADRELVDVLFQPLTRTIAGLVSEYEKFIEMVKAYMSVDRPAAFEAIYKEKCRANIRKDPIHSEMLRCATLDRLARKTKAIRPTAFAKAGIRLKPLRCLA